MHETFRWPRSHLHGVPTPLADRRFRFCFDWLRIAGLALGVGLLMGCAGPVPGEPDDRLSTRSPDAEADEDHSVVSTRPIARMTPQLQGATRRLLETPSGGSAWAPWPLPGKTFAAFEPAVALGHPAIMVKANRSVSILRQRYAEGLHGASRLTFSWRIDALAKDADLTTAEGDDSPVRIVLAFDGDRSRLSARVHRLSEMSRLLTGEDLPYATLAYVWSNAPVPDAIVTNRRSDRIRKIVVEAGPARLGQWLAYERDIQADFRAAFGEEPGPLMAVSLMTDTDNTRSQLRAWYGPLTLRTAEP